MTDRWAWHTWWEGFFKADCLSCHTWWMTVSLDTNMSWFRRKQYYKDVIYNGPYSQAGGTSLWLLGHSSFLSSANIKHSFSVTVFRTNTITKLFQYHISAKLFFNLRKAKTNEMLNTVSTRGAIQRFCQYRIQNPLSVWNKWIKGDITCRVSGP